ncbi:DUF3574 domain-containing protein [Phenylobacterium sp. J367]|uniref:DUF3574 domain-containing protein n=1 Tax=Phenylobacterium sp. J367 TaxID=2898435 RepID=UPI00215124F4|nr:DUF3574 domain-containing protein [Phenylobacterium sp. J367]MCR5880722.1 DUF3574 domain-containing protein [Phenylobacterium sp. J367]
MRRAGGIGLATLLLAGCASVHVEPGAEAACPAGQEHLRTAQLFFGRHIGDKPGVSDADFARFVDAEITPRFPDGLTVLDGGGQWRGADSQLIRESAKVVLIVLPKGGDAPKRIEAVRAAYKKQFSQEAVLLITQAACVSF